MNMRDCIYRLRGLLRFFWQSTGFMLFAVLSFLLSVSVVPVWSGMPMRPISGHPSAENLKKGLPDLSVEALRVRYHVKPGRNTIPAVVTAEVHNVGATSSQTTRLHCSLQNGKRREEKIITIRALKGGRSSAVKWSTSLTPGANTIVLRVDDRNNPANNQATKTIRIKAQRSTGAGGPPIQGITHRGSGNESPFAKAAPLIHANTRNLHPDLTISQIIFNDFKAKKPGETWVQIKIRNIGTVASPKTWLLGTIKRADGTVERNRLPVPSIAPRQLTTIEGPIRMTPGLNSLAVEVRDPGTPGNNRMTRRHRFGVFARKLPQRKDRPTMGIKRLRPEVAARPDVNTAGKAIGSRSVSTSAAQALGAGKAAVVTEKNIHSTPASKTSTRDQRLQQRFQAPRQGEVVCLGRPYTIKWHISEDGANEISHLGLRLDAVDSHLSLNLVSELASTARSYIWRVNPHLPSGQYQLSLTFQQGGEVHSCSVPIRLDRVRFHLGAIEVEPAKPRQAKVGKPVIVSALLTSAGADALHPFANQILVTGPRGFNRVCFQAVDELRHDEPGPRRLACQFVPPFYGMYKAVVQVDSQHNYPGSTSEIEEQSSVKQINVNPLPDLLLYTNKVPDDRGNIKKKHFHIHVKNIGQATSPETTVTFFLSGTGHHHYQVPSLEPGQVWEHDYTHRRWTSGKKEYWAAVDPDNRIEEIDETNNRMEDQFYMYDAGAAMPKHEHQPPKLVVEAVYGLRYMVAGRKQLITIRFRNQSPDRQVYSETHQQWQSNRVHIKWGDACYPVEMPDLMPGERYDFTITLPAGDAGNNVWFQIIQEHWEQVGTQAVDCEEVQSKWEHIWHEIIDGYPSCSKPTYERRDRSLFYNNRVVVQSVEATPAETLARNAELFHNTRHQSGQNDMHILQPMRQSFWTIGQSAQIVWAGMAHPPYSLNLVPLANPGAAVLLADNLTGNSFQYQVAEGLVPGQYRLTLRWAEGRTRSSVFEIRNSRKPDLTVKAASANTSYHPDAEIPYSIHIKAIVENKGGFEAVPFKVAITVKKKGSSAGKGEKVDFTDPLTATAVSVPSMGDNQVFPVSFDFPVQEAGTYAITIKVDATDQVDELNEDNNTVQPHCIIRPQRADLELAGCRQVGDILRCMVYNRGDLSSNALIAIVFNHKTKKLPFWSGGSREEAVLRESYVGSIEPGQSQSTTIEIPSVFLREGGKYKAELQRASWIQEFKENNTAEGVVVAAGESLAHLKNMFRVTDRTEHQPSLSASHGGCDRSGKLHFRFTIQNQDKQFETLPLEAMLVVKKNGRVVVGKSFSVPGLSPRAGVLPRSTGKKPWEFMIDWPGIACQPGEQLHYSLHLHWHTDTWQVASGNIQVTR